MASFSITAPRARALIIRPQAGIFYANVAKVTDSIKLAAKDIDKTLEVDLKYSPCLDSTAARGILDSMAELKGQVDHIIISNCGECVKTDLKRYARSEPHKEVLDF